jgi:hypothetical protein
MNVGGDIRFIGRLPVRRDVTWRRFFPPGRPLTAVRNNGPYGEITPLCSGDAYCCWRIHTARIRGFADRQTAALD